VDDLASERSRVAWGLKDLIWAGLLAFGLFGAATILAILLGRWAPVQARMPWASYLRGLILALSELAFVVAAWVFGARKPGVRWRDLGVRSFNIPAGCLAALALFLLMVTLNAAWGLILRLLGWSGQPPILPLFGDGEAGLVLALVGTVLIGPFAEELFFRGLMFPALRQRFGFWLGVGIDAALFALLHFTPTVFPPILAMGLLFCLLYQHTGSIWPGVMLHGSINLLALLAARILSG